MKEEYVRIDVLTMIESSAFGENNTYHSNMKWIKELPDVEFREDYQCFFIKKGTKSHTAIALKFGDVFD